MSEGNNDYGYESFYERFYTMHQFCTKCTKQFWWLGSGELFLQKVDIILAVEGETEPTVVWTGR